MTDGPGSEPASPGRTGVNGLLQAPSRSDDEDGNGVELVVVTDTTTTIPPINSPSWEGSPPPAAAAAVERGKKPEKEVACLTQTALDGPLFDFKRLRAEILKLRNVLAATDGHPYPADYEYLIEVPRPHRNSMLKILDAVIARPDADNARDLEDFLLKMGDRVLDGLKGHSPEEVTYEEVGKICTSFIKSKFMSRQGVRIDHSHEGRLLAFLQRHSVITLVIGTFASNTLKNLAWWVHLKQPTQSLVGAVYKSWAIAIGEYMINQVTTRAITNAGINNVTHKALSEAFEYATFFPLVIFYLNKTIAPGEWGMFSMIIAGLAIDTLGKYAKTRREGGLWGQSFYALTKHSAAKKHFDEFLDQMRKQNVPDIVRAQAWNRYAQATMETLTDNPSTCHRVFTSMVDELVQRQVISSKRARGIGGFLSDLTPNQRRFLAVSIVLVGGGAIISLSPVSPTAQALSGDFAAAWLKMFAWYMMLAFPGMPLWGSFIVSVAFFAHCEYWLMVRANRIGVAAGVTVPVLKAVSETADNGGQGLLAKFFLRNKMAWHAVVCLVLLVLAVFVGFITTYDENDSDV